MIPSPTGMTYRDMVLGDRFYYGAEIVTTRGITPPGTPNTLLGLASDLLADPRIGWISITDNPGGGPMLPPDWLAGTVAEHRQRVVLHMTCKDMNRNGLESAAWRYAAEGFNNILALTGDYPTMGYHGLAGPVFDIDSVALIAMLRAMNEGLKVPGRRGAIETLPKTAFFIGCAVSPFKQYERELMPQYFRLVRKLAAGAKWIIPQFGYDMRKYHEVKLMLASRGLSAPIIGNAYMLSRGVARLFNAGKLAGCVVTDELMNVVDRYAAGEDKGKKFFEEFAAKQLAVFKGLGFAGGYLGGVFKAETFGKIIEIADGFGQNDWKDFLKEIQYSQPGEFFLFDHSPVSGMATATEINPEYLKSLRNPPKSREVTLGYRISRKVHDWAFTRGKGLFGLMAKIYGWLDKKPDGLMSRMAHALERLAKFVGYGCQDCGDCSLPDCAYLCPLTLCSKNMRNGPCGGSKHGRCELDDKECLWARVYERMKHYGESELMLGGPVVFYNAELKYTSSWANTFLARDHSAADENENAEGGPQEANSEGAS